MLDAAEVQHETASRFASTRPGRPATRTLAGAQAARSRAADLLAALVAHDSLTAEHSHEAAALARDVGQRIGVAPTDLDELESAALLHDVGKVLIPTETLNKPEALDAGEWSLIKRHPELGANLLGGLPGLEGIARTIRQHHERPDGTGYPAGLVGDEISVAASIISVCDAFQAMTSSRPYQTPKSTRAALEEIERGAGTQFDERAAAGLAGVLGADPRYRPEPVCAARMAAPTGDLPAASIDETA